MRHRYAIILTTSLMLSCGGRQQGESQAEVPPQCEAFTDEADAVRTAWDTPATLISGGTVMTAAGDVFSPGYVLLESGSITAVGAGVGSAPDGAEVVDATGMWVTPGIIDTHSHLGVYPTPSAEMHADGNEATSPTTPQVQAVHSIWPQDPGFQRALGGGITTMQILPGSANLIGGRGFVMHNHPGARNAEDVRFPGAPETLKMACGENPKRVYGTRGQMPSTRMGSVATVRQTWVDAAAYRETWDTYESDLHEWCDAGADEENEPDMPARDLGLETLAEVLRGDTLPQIHCYRADEMLTQLQIADEFGFAVRSFHHAVEAYKIRDVLAEAGVAVSTWADWWGFKIEAFDSVIENAALVHEAGGRAIIHSDSAIGIQRLNQEAAKAYFAGLDAGIDLTEDDALRWITANPAWAIGVDDATGTLEVGKAADVVLWDHHPFSVYARAVGVWVDGVHELSADAEARPWSDFEIGLWPDQLLVTLGASVGEVAQQDEPAGTPRGDVCVTGATVLSPGRATGSTDVCFADGRITWVGRGTPAAADVFDGTGMVLTPGLTELRTQIGLVEISGVSHTRNADSGIDDPVRAAFRVLDALNADTVLVPIARDGGITSAVSLPQGGLIAGEGVWLDLVDGTAADMAVPEGHLLVMGLGNGAGQTVGTSRGTALLRYREMFEDVRAWASDQRAFEDARMRELAVSRLDLRALEPVLDGELPVLVSASSRADIRAGIALADEFGLDLVLAEAGDAWAMADEIADAGVPVVINPLYNLPYTFEALGQREDAAAILDAAGVDVVLSTGSSHNARTLRQVAGNAVRAGMTPDAALEAVTVAPARAAGLGGDYGTIDVGKVANLVLWSGDPFELSTRAMHVWVRGNEQPMRSRQVELFERYRELIPGVTVPRRPTRPGENEGVEASSH